MEKHKKFSPQYCGNEEMEKGIEVAAQGLGLSVQDAAFRVQEVGFWFRISDLGLVV